MSYALDGFAVTLSREAFWESAEVLSANTFSSG